MLGLIVHLVASIVGGALAVGIFVLALWLSEAIPNLIWRLRHRAGIKA